jgi:hypothetical protein
VEEVGAGVLEVVKWFGLIETLDDTDWIGYMDICFLMGINFIYRAQTNMI